MRILDAILVLTAIAGMAWVTFRESVEKLTLDPRAIVPRSHIVDGQVAARLPEGGYVSEVAALDDEMMAFLTFDYLRSRSALKQVEVLLNVSERSEGPKYTILFHLPNDLVRAVGLLHQYRADGWISDFEVRIVSPRLLADRQQQTKVFVAAYNFPVRERMERLSESELLAYIERFILFKSHTDPRVQKQMDPLPKVLSSEEAQRLAADIIAVADFYDLPLDLFLGIGAIENNYMNVRGDRNHAVWKRRAERGDIVLRRRRGRVLVLNYATGVWQITRETLRVAHKLYLRDERDYSLLPARLRPEKKLNLNEIDSKVLTTYAGVLFRHLLDRFDGDIGQAVGAYNGGPGNPNPRYEAGVRVVADYARKVLEQAAVLNGQSVDEIRWIAPARPGGGNSGIGSRPSRRNIFLR